MFHVQEGQPKGPDYQVLSLITTSTADDRESLQEKTDLLSTLPQVQGRNAHYVLVIMIQCSLKASYPILISALYCPQQGINTLRVRVGLNLDLEHQKHA